jgi:hypothetical protein
MAHCKKFTKAACGHMWKHYERAKDENGEYIKFGNQEIDSDKSYLNFNLAPVHLDGQGAFVKKRCGEVKMQNRADVNVMCSWIITKPKEVEETEKFFRETYRFLSERYGKDNVVSAYVHMDESTPHIHFAFVPVVMDKKKNILKVSAKEAIDRQELKVFHQELSVYMEEVFGRDIGILNEATKDGNKNKQEMQKEQALRELEEIEEKIKDGQQEEKKIKADIKILKWEKDKIEKEISGRKIEMEKINEIKAEKMTFGNGVKIDGVTVKDIERLKRSAYKNYENEKELAELKKVNEENEKSLSKLKTSEWGMRKKNAEYQAEIRDLKKDLNYYKSRTDFMEQTIERLPEEMKKYIEPIINPPPDEQERSRLRDDWER